jgi:hypothetical protein
MRIGEVWLTLLEVLGGGVDKLQGNKLEAALLEASNDVADETALDTVGLLLLRCDRYGVLLINTVHDGRSKVGGRTLTMMYVRS